MDERYHPNSFPRNGRADTYPAYSLRPHDNRDSSRSRYSIDEGRMPTSKSTKMTANILAGAESGAQRGYIDMPHVPDAPVRYQSRSSHPPYPMEQPSRSMPVDSGRPSQRERSTSRGRRRSSNRHSTKDTAPVDDYDWYDADGMKVRVREI